MQSLGILDAAEPTTIALKRIRLEPKFQRSLGGNQGTLETQSGHNDGCRTVCRGFPRVGG